jgi:hypothetical protein
MKHVFMEQMKDKKYKGKKVAALYVKDKASRCAFLN